VTAAVSEGCVHHAMSSPGAGLGEHRSIAWACVGHAAASSRRSRVGAALQVPCAGRRMAGCSCVVAMRGAPVCCSAPSTHICWRAGAGCARILVPLARRVA
jgi:hypothetical protein